MKPLWVQQFFLEWGFYPMTGGTLGDGTTWDETTPTDGTLVSQIDDYDRDLRAGTRSRMALEHEWPSSQAVTAQAGQHKFVTLQNQAAKPTLAGTQVGAVYAKTSALYFENSAGVEVQITTGTAVNVPNFATGSGVAKALMIFSGTSSGTYSPTYGFNIANIVKTASGEYNVFFTTPFVDTKIVAIGLGQIAPGANSRFFQVGTFTPITITSFPLESFTGNLAKTDMSTYASMVFFGGQ